MENSIPKKIHYCWFGGKEKPKLAYQCIDSWKKYFPDYEIIEWNEKNFDVFSSSYMKQAYENKKWAFVSDYARFKILYDNGGLYFDTDVEVIKSFEPILKNGPFMGCEANDGGLVFANPGLGIGAYAQMSFYKEILDYYDFINFDIKETVCNHTTKKLIEYGFKGNGEVEKVADISVYPAEYFCPQNYYTGTTTITDNTYSIHRYAETWHSEKEIKFHGFEQKMIQKYGTKISNNALIKVTRTLYCEGMKGLTKKISEKLFGRQ